MSEQPTQQRQQTKKKGADQRRRKIKITKLVPSREPLSTVDADAVVVAVAVDAIAPVVVVVVGAVAVALTACDADNDGCALLTAASTISRRFGGAVGESKASCLRFPEGVRAELSAGGRAVIASEVKVASKSKATTNIEYVRDGTIRSDVFRDAWRSLVGLCGCE